MFPLARRVCPAQAGWNYLHGISGDEPSLGPCTSGCPPFTGTATGARARMFAAWSRVRRSKQPAAYARKVLLNRHLLERPSPGGRSRQETLADNARYQEQARRLLEGQGEGDVTPASPTIASGAPAVLSYSSAARAAMGPGCDASLGPAQFSWRLPRPRTPPPGSMARGRCCLATAVPVLSVDQPTALVVPLLCPIGAVPAHRISRNSTTPLATEIHATLRQAPSAARACWLSSATTRAPRKMICSEVPPAVSDWCVAIGSDNGPYARTHPNIGGTVALNRNAPGKPSKVEALLHGGPPRRARTTRPCR